ncbi:MAG: hypothetical protein D6679_03985 [Candidatus Hydrogenedentota bacterium]|nr:MAG: hypothetical protein D6679_03985 [Candidatus Hydrogenedentota bacterium]
MSWIEGKGEESSEGREFKRRTLFRAGTAAVFLAVILLAEMFGGCGRAKKNAAGDETISAADSEWAGSLAELQKRIREAGAPFGVVIITGSEWGRYEKDIYESPEIKPLLAAVPRMRVDWKAADALRERYGAKDAPGLWFLDGAGREITHLEGARDVAFVRRVFEHVREYPKPRTELRESAEKDSGARIRLIEVLLETGNPDTALLECRRTTKELKGAQPALLYYLHAYSAGEAGALREAERVARQYLRKFPGGSERAAVRWIQTFLAMKQKRQRSAERTISKMLSADSTSPYTRQAVTAFAIQYLARSKRDPAAAERFLTKAIKAGTPWSADFLLARALVRSGLPNGMPAALEDLRTVVKEGGERAEEGLDQLTAVAASRVGAPWAADIILFLQKMARSESLGFAARLRLAQLYLLNGDVTLADEEARLVSASGGPLAPAGMLLRGSIALDGEGNPKKALAAFGECLEKFAGSTWEPAARYGRARALFFLARVKDAAEAYAFLEKYLQGRRYLPESFRYVLPSMMPAEVFQSQIAAFRRKLAELEKEKNGAAVLKEYVAGTIAAARGDTETATRVFRAVTADYPASSLADDAYIQLGTLAIREGRVREATKHWQRVVNSYKGSDQYERARQYLAGLRRFRG